MSIKDFAVMQVGDKITKEEFAGDILKSLMQNRIKTTMVGAISSIEKYLGFLFAQNEERELTPEEQEIKDIFLDLRKDILDKGNTEIRKLDEDFKKFNITRKVYQIKLPVKG